MTDENVHVHDAKVQVDRNAYKFLCTVFIIINRCEQKFKWQDNIL